MSQPQAAANDTQVFDELIKYADEEAHRRATRAIARLSRKRSGSNGPAQGQKPLSAHNAAVTGLMAAARASGSPMQLKDASKIVAAFNRRAPTTH